jgi:hypothetical protein
MIKTILILLICIASVPAEDYWRPIFDGNTLDNFDNVGEGPFDGRAFKVENNEIVCVTEKGTSVHSMLWTKKEYEDFTIRLKYKADQGCSGLYYHSQPASGILGVNTPAQQVEIDDDEAAGGIYETGGRTRWMFPTVEAHTAVYKDNDWNELILEIYGQRITTTINGTQMISFTDREKPSTSGRFAFQAHGGVDNLFWFKNFDILDSSYCETDEACPGQACDTVSNACMAIAGCTDSTYEEYDPQATVDDGSCETLGISAGNRNKIVFNTELSRPTLTVTVSGLYYLRISDTRGKNIRSETGRGPAVYDVSHLDHGMYFITLITRKATVHRKLCIM